MIMTTSPAGRAALTLREGCRLIAYRDSVGVWTIGVGHTGRASLPLVVPGMRITQGAADEILSRDLVPFEAAVNTVLHGRVISQNAFDACVSLAFNIGAAAFSGSTVARDIANDNMAGAAEAILMWVKPPELRGRRESERAQFLRPDDHSGIAAVAGAPVLNTIIARVNQAANGELVRAAPVVLPSPPIGPHNPVQAAPQTAWQRFVALFNRKVA